MPQIAVFTWDAELQAYGAPGSRPVLLAIYEDGAIIWSDDGEPPFLIGEVSVSAVDRVVEELRAAEVLARARREPPAMWPGKYSFYDVIVLKWGDETLHIVKDPVVDYIPGYDAAWERIKQALLSLRPEGGGVEDDSVSFRYRKVPVPPRHR